MFERARQTVEKAEIDKFRNAKFQMVYPPFKSARESDRGLNKNPEISNPSNLSLPIRRKRIRTSQSKSQSEIELVPPSIENARTGKTEEQKVQSTLVRECISYTEPKGLKVSFKTVGLAELEIKNNKKITDKVDFQKAHNLVRLPVSENENYTYKIRLSEINSEQVYLDLRVIISHDFFLTISFKSNDLMKKTIENRNFSGKDVTVFRYKTNELNSVLKSMVAEYIDYDIWHSGILGIVSSTILFNL